MRFLLDEHVEHEVAGRLEDRGHDVVHVGLTDRLSKGIDDSAVGDVSVAETRVIVTYDDDFRRELTDDDYYAVLLFGDEELPPDTVTRVLDEIATYYDTAQLQGLQTVGQSWL